MPKIVDHQERREQLAAALCRIVAARGLDAVSVREVAAEAGVSIGMVQHYFHSKDEMLLFAGEWVVETQRQRITALIDQRQKVRDVMRRAMAELLPLDTQRRAEARVWAAFAARAAVSPQLAAAMREIHARYRASLARAIGHARALGQAPPDLDVAREALLLAATVDGLAMQALAYPDGATVGELLGALDTQLDRIFTRIG